METVSKERRWRAAETIPQLAVSVPAGKEMSHWIAAPKPGLSVMLTHRQAESSEGRKGHVRPRE